MLTRLELIGFKSFADRTRFDFAAGITAVVGPNGSGKSNIVDAVRWLLGEQSAKNLRGGEMTDVIFNGSSTRKSLGMAEVTMSFDNQRRIFNADADEVQVTRRVYRDGEGEYLINGQIVRLKDVKELFLGSGAGHAAYSIIEQGRVDALLSASTKDRRLIFEEAAGISRFKAKKLESLRKLERVDGDLMRVRDILVELDKQLRTLRLQAAKSQRYQEYSARLRELRVGLGRTEFSKLSAELAQEETTLATLRAELASVSQRAEAGESELRQLDWNISRTSESLRLQESRLAEARQLIAAQDAAVRTERNQTANIEAEMLRLGKQRTDLAYRIRVLATEQVRLTTELRSAHTEAEQGQTIVQGVAANLSAVTARIADLGTQIQTDRNEQFELVTRSARHHSDAETARTQAERLAKDLARKQADVVQLSGRYQALDTALTELSRSDADIQHQLVATRQSYQEYVTARDQLRTQAETIQSDLEARREHRSSLRGRAEVLEGLERGLEGLGSGVRDVLHRLANGDPLLTHSVVGLVADLLTVPSQYASLIDVALGAIAERFVVRNASDLDSMLAELSDLPGRVGFLPLRQSLAAPQTSPWSGNPACISAASVVRCDHPELAGLPNQLLGRVAIVPDLATAHALASGYPDYTFLTHAGDVLEPCGAVVVGAPQAGGGILSRKTELRELRSQITSADAGITAIEAQQASLRERADAYESPIRALEAEITTLSGTAGTLRDQILEQRQVQRQLADSIDLLTQESAILDAERVRAHSQWKSAHTLAIQVDNLATELRARLEQNLATQTEAEHERERCQLEHTQAQVVLSRLREQVAGLQSRRDALDSELKQRRIDGVNLASTERATRQRLLDSQLATLRATAIAASAYLDKDARDRQIAELVARRDLLTTARDELDSSLRQSREFRLSRQSVLHSHELAAQDLRSRRDAIVRRIHEDFAVDLAASPDPDDDVVPLALATPNDSGTPGSTLGPEQEIADLRRKIEKLGSVNLEALAELADLEKRESELRSQHDDLTDARGKLQSIIDQINTDSRRLFAETLANIRAHFQELFRKLFAGGMADIVLEDETDILESGIEITVRPPGKELRKISLLSGGEKALTAVALLLAVFRSKPSPFCLLDEVDAAMDEANTQRLAQLLREFADRSQFIVITHKKRTMAAADVLYGVTMQESGVSKQVGVRFEDWPDEEAAADTRAAA